MSKKKRQKKLQDHWKAIQSGRFDAATSAYLRSVFVVVAQVAEGHEHPAVICDVLGLSRPDSVLIDVSCPACTHEFETAVRVLNVPTATCPACGVKFDVGA